MLVLITGGAASGKSEIAETLAVAVSGGRLAYIATMLPQDEECGKRIGKHQKMRDGKGFATLEIPCNVYGQPELFDGYDTVLLECMSNLILNEMFVSGKDAKCAVQAIGEDILKISEKVKNLIVVSGTIFLDLKTYDAFTHAYVDAISRLNCKISHAADVVIETVCSLPIFHKGKKEITVYENPFLIP